MQSDYMYMNDNIYALSEEVKLMFHTVASFNISGKVYSNYNEYKINGKTDCNTMIKRVLSYYLFFEDRRDGVEKISIFPENMFELLQIFDHIKKNWIERDAFGIYGFMDNSLAVVNHDEFIFMRLPMDKAIKFAPGVLKTDMGDTQCIDLYLNSNNPLQITHNTFLGMYYVLSHFDMLNYANMALSFMMLMSNPMNRVDFSSSGSSNNTPLRDPSTVSGTSRSFNKSNKSAFFDD